MDDRAVVCSTMASTVSWVSVPSGKATATTSPTLQPRASASRSPMVAPSPMAPSMTSSCTMSPARRRSRPAIVSTAPSMSASTTCMGTALIPGTVVSPAATVGGTPGFVPAGRTTRSLVTTSVTSPRIVARAVEANIVAPATSITPIVSAAAVAAERFGLRTAFAAAMRPLTPSRRIGTAITEATGRTSTGPSAIDARNSTTLPSPTSGADCCATPMADCDSADHGEHGPDEFAPTRADGRLDGCRAHCVDGGDRCGTASRDQRRGDRHEHADQHGGDDRPRLDHQ